RQRAAGQMARAGSTDIARRLLAEADRHREVRLRRAARRVRRVEVAGRPLQRLDGGDHEDQHAVSDRAVSRLLGGAAGGGEGFQRQLLREVRRAERRLEQPHQLSHPVGDVHQRLGRSRFAPDIGRRQRPVHVRGHPDQPEQPAVRTARKRVGCLHADCRLRELEMVSVQQPLPRLRDRAAESAALPRSRANHRALAIAAGLAGLLGALLVAAPAPAPLSTSQQKILVDGQPTFLTGVSLFDALGSAPPRDADLDALGPWGVNTVRVWAHWHTPVYQSDGALTADGRLRLLALAGRLQSRSLILELVVLRPGQLPGQPVAVFASEAARLKAVEAITETLRPFRNVLFDLYNEHDHPDGPISHAAARALRDRVKAIDPSRLAARSRTHSTP